MRRAIWMILILLCFLVATPQSAIVAAADEISTASQSIEDAIAKLNVKDLAGNANTVFAGKVGNAIESLKKAQQLLSGAQDQKAAGESFGKNLADAEAEINRAITELDSAKSLALKPDTQKAISTIRTSLGSSLQSLGTLHPKEPSNSTSPKPSPNESPAEEHAGFIDRLLPYVFPILQAGVVLLVVGLLIYSVMLLLGLRRTTNEYLGGALPKTLGSMRARHDDLAKQVEAAAALNKDTNQRLADVHTELRQMSRGLQQSALANNRATNPVSYPEPPARASDVPVFPIAADELLRQMRRKSLVVKRDFQNDMLVSDPDGKGELVLLRDPEIREELQPLFIVPSVTQFQMRQEYHNFYEKYYDCANPEAGAIWIKDPAVVEKVPGGWQLREKGRLEVR